MDTEGLEVKITGSRDKSITYWKDGVMIGRKCTVCKEDKEIGEFNFQNKKKGTYHSQCKECESKKKKEYREKNKEEINKKKKEYYEKNKEYIKERDRRYRENNKEQIKERKKRWRENNPEYMTEYMKRWRENNPEYDKEWRGNNKEQIKEYNKKLKETQYYKKYFENNIERYHERDKRWRENSKENNLQYISTIVEQINPIFKQLNLPTYGYVYMFENVKTGHKYLGQSIQPINRRYTGGIVQGWIRERLKYDNQKFKEELIEEDIVVTEVLDVAFCQYHLDKLEAYYINKYNSFLNGYNNNAGQHETDDGLEEFMEILQRHNLEFADGQIVKKAN